ncbi:MAG: hypothetical protein SAJ12_19650 [Jaaginema sp. PMC 1079.18]|nr:hypothetical protein [Jaaginema sp. PMC 1080.18]MEC4853203.1 hypothetical protein [Jaaginema sp. PMC 1079.18]MEC4866154.1 hypothetical protein [Jaaginema sp. PMC 1078.18]
MGTRRPKIQGYILPELYARYETWKHRQGITKDSQALNQILQEFLAVEVKTASEARIVELEEKLLALSQQVAALARAVVDLQATEELVEESPQSMQILEAIAAQQTVALVETNSQRFLVVDRPANSHDETFEIIPDRDTLVRDDSFPSDPSSDTLTLEAGSEDEVG